ncbi:MipA/OmpV family protein [Shewanella sp. NIFS-20-20]|uniref:MipA/OmpV family protein n=1 Tax=Shewanella sp. NIFS-20-20 TaxID=2853806 RepID=UPI001C475141|nr:MipA/OmpV family protein [Shewanella sp. NIFS-20-20]MBV7314451.1 MipA/OmpV family protein [Shewanella sp. NIFS-20-20]
MIRVITGLLLLIYSHITWGQESICDNQFDCISTGQWSFSVAVGYGEKSNPLSQQQAIPIYVIPSLAYYGESFFFDNGLFGYSIAENRDFALNMIATYSGDRGYFYRWDPSNIFVSGASRQVNDEHPGHGYSLYPEASSAAFNGRNFTYIAGIEAWYFNAVADISVSLGHDVFAVHNGMEAQITISRRFDWKPLSLELNATAHWQDSDVISYYYQPRPEELGYGTPYQASSGWSPQVSATLTYALNDHWQLLGLARFRQLADSITASPLVSSSDSHSLFMGVAYQW